MNDMSTVITPKSDQLNAEDFLSGPKTYTIEGVAIQPGAEQPVNIKLAGENRTWRPCKSMSRCMVAAWGPDASQYAGRSVTLYRDPTVKWGGMEVGGIRISHLSHIEKDLKLQLTATRGKRAVHNIRVLSAPAAQTEPAHDPTTHLPALEAAADNGTDALKAAWGSMQKADRQALENELQRLKDRAEQADNAAIETEEVAGGWE